MDASGLSDIEYERYYNPDNSIFLSSKKLVSEIPALSFVLCSTFLFFVVRYLWQNHVLKPIAVSINMKKSYSDRFLENGWYSFYYLTFFIFGTYVYSKETWSIFPTMNIWLGWPIQPFKPLFRYYYLLELSFYIHCTIALSFETKRKDFYQMLTHHVSTFFLVAASYWYRYHRIGIAILWLHNISDIFLYSAKSLNYVCKTTKNNYKLYLFAETMFVLFVISFFVMRLVFLPFALIRSTLFEASYVSIFFPLFYPTNVCLVTLEILHMFWFYLIIKIIYNKFFKKENFDDIRSDSDEEESKPKSKKSLEAEKPSTVRNRENKKNSNNNKSPQAQQANNKPKQSKKKE
ncbi:hypothetical protein DICPUDRAFT_98903 [Dictyostelium purpureum]|uniref:TLC domain-containing protein n=1 Tax=Dictyostelium purpureum TaxID=5786 RepID=F0ZUN4_DICPU|nr:uncharacterized protein DICPUDRAFT_98903 [Dictyostelium purpureum]EGC32326.1 hypothetical protein DICPUDRAFT_98903 [Dictyostelium purpureum]|eukprot:XP_003291128.1 hypothetical protein DICPUDRAFT_98903 [Dictyostelium purpureum]